MWTIYDHFWRYKNDETFYCNIGIHYDDNGNTGTDNRQAGDRTTLQAAVPGDEVNTLIAT